MNDLSRVTLVAALCFAAAAPAQTCSVEQLTRDLTLFRRWSLDLRGRAATAAEIDALVSRGGVRDADLEALLASPDLKTVERERLRADLYGALQVQWETDFGLTRTDAASSTVYESSGDVLWVPNRGPRYRHSIAFRTCDITRLQTAFDANRRPVVDSATGREGYVLVHPYWAPANVTMKVCALDAQSFTRGPVSQVDCSSLAARGVEDCGCGPELRYCQVLGGYDGLRPTGADLNEAFVEQTIRFVDRILDEHRPYSDLVLSPDTEVNGPIAHYLRWQTGTVYGADTSSRPDLGYPIPTSLQWADKGVWTKVTSTGKSAGVLTQPHWLLKFASNRARANRFYNVFLCSSFQAPPGGLPGPDEPCSRNPDLAQRCGCDSCHRSLEPMAAHWGRFAEHGTHELKTPEFPTADPSCDDASGPVSERCQLYYLTHPRHPAEAPYVGKLKAYLFADVNHYAQNIDDGPYPLARAAVDSGEFARCTVRKEFQRLVGRAVRDELPDERALLDRLTERFLASNHDLRVLLRELMTTRQYRSAEGATEP